MFERIIFLSVKNKFLVALFTLAIVAGGFYALEHIPVDAVPDITNNQVQVVTHAPSLSAEEVERFITYPIELSMANLPGVVELRSISRYGLSVITIVFEEGMPVTDTRQFVSEQISIAAGQIPEGMGHPELMPVTTGLGEIYQYTLEVDDAWTHQYDPMELRAIQDWIVKRQLAGIDGVVEVSSFGGFSKQVQVSVDPLRLRAFDLTMQDVLTALSENNQNTGGGYVRQHANAVYIRAEGVVSDAAEVGNVVVKTEGTPVLLKQVAEIGNGYPPRYGAMTRNGEGEAVGGITLMLKNANSSATLKNIHERVAEVQASLPEGVRIVPYLDRSDLVGRTTRTIKTNLIEGGAIVIVVLVLLLGNWRAGLIVASVIPLSLMFAFIMMHVFGVSANLMSLGALDFGIVVDGAVIIVEGVLHALVVYHAGKTLTRDRMDDVVARSAGAIYRSAAFGVLIIVVVFIPIMTLTGIEGKMFRPMAQTVSFAVLGALILSLTYVPTAAALFMKRTIDVKPNFSDKIMKKLRALYEPLLQKALDFPKTTVIIAGVLLTVSVVLFSRLGGVFIPQLEEGDIAMQMTLPTGSSLQESIRTTTQAERLLLENFPEVRHVVSKIGTAEVPTDPMSVELADIMIVMKDKEEWTSAETREELIAMMEETLAVITGASFDFTQPIQLRFNELMTGAKTDVALKIFGEDMAVLHDLATDAATIAAEIDGAADVVVEQTEGLPQLLIRYDRERLARYGVSVRDVNTIIRSAYAGEPAGVVFEGERKYDLVVRLADSHRERLDFGKLLVRGSGGQLIPLAELATAEETAGPAQISRDDARRRITVGINVRGRDVENVVEDIQSRLNEKLMLPAGYYVRYGGDFENLQHAKQRLSIAVPVALVMILMLLYFAFGSIRYALLIFVAVPLSAIGGVFSLWLRDLPFSISAGVGFIALFGVAVLNGIVLISYFNDLKAEGKLSLDDVILKGSAVRLRPVIMTASVAALGFLPMALSTTAGAEVQRPLATVVIGGLVSATLLTLVVLPVLYRTMERYAIKRVRITPSAGVLLLLLLSVPAFSQLPEQTMTEGKAVEMALSSHPDIRWSELEIQRQRAMSKRAWDTGPTTAGFQYGQMNSSAQDPYLEINQPLGNIFSQARRAKVHGHAIRRSEAYYLLSKKELTREVREAWLEWLFYRQVIRELTRQLALYEDFQRRADVQYRAGERSLLEKSIAENSLHAVQNEYVLQRGNLEQAEAHLRFLLGTDVSLRPESDTLTVLVRPGDSLSNSHPVISARAEAVKVAHAEWRFEKSAFAPDLSVGYFRQTITEPDIQFRGMNGITLELAIPLWFRPQAGNVQRAKIETLQAQQQLDLARRQLRNQWRLADTDANRYGSLLNYYHERGLAHVEEIRRTASLQISAGEIDFFQYVQSLQRYTDMRLQYFQTLRDYNKAIIQLQYLAE